MCVQGWRAHLQDSTWPFHQLHLRAFIDRPAPRKIPFKSLLTVSKGRKKTKTEEPAMSNPRIDKSVGILELFDDPILLSWTTVLGFCLEHPHFRKKRDFSWLFHGNQTWLARKSLVRWCYPDLNIHVVDFPAKTHGPHCPALSKARAHHSQSGRLHQRAANAKAPPCSWRLRFWRFFRR